MVSNLAFPWQNIFSRCGFALCLCGSGGPSKIIGLPSPVRLRGADSDSWLLTSWGSPCLVPATPG